MSQSFGAYCRSSPILRIRICSIKLACHSNQQILALRLLRSVLPSWNVTKESHRMSEVVAKLFALLGRVLMTCHGSLPVQLPSGLYKRPATLNNKSYMYFSNSGRNELIRYNLSVCLRKLSPFYCLFLQFYVCFLV